MTHLYWGDPNEEFSLRLAKTLVDSGADILEIGVPYTDPMCDGPVFQRACHRAIAAGTTPIDVFEGIRKLRTTGTTQPIYLTSYFGPIFKMGITPWMKRAQSVGVSGLIIPDILLEEQQELEREATKYSLSVIQFATVYSSTERLKQIIAASTDFIYCIALPGVTGDKHHVIVRPQPKQSRSQHRDPTGSPRFLSVARDDIKLLIHRIKSLTDLPIYVGFGIRSGEDVQEILSYGADGIIVGSAIATIYEKYMDKNNSEESSLREISLLIRGLKNVSR